MPLHINNAAQWGFVVRDIEAAMKHWRAVHGVGPFLHLKTIQPYEHQGVYKGVPSNVRITAAFSYFGETQIELIQQLNDGPSPYRDFLQSGAAGLQHIGFWTSEYDRDYASLEAANYKPVYRAGMRGVARETVYFEDQSGMFGPMLELSLSTPAKMALFSSMARFVRQSSTISEQFESMDDLAKQLGMKSWTSE